MTGGVMSRALATSHDRRYQLQVVFHQLDTGDTHLPLEMWQIGLIKTGCPDIKQALFLTNRQIGLHGDTSVDVTFLHNFDNPGILIEQRHERNIRVGLKTIMFQDLPDDPVRAAADAEQAETLSF